MSFFGKNQNKTIKSLNFEITENERANVLPTLEELTNIWEKDFNMFLDIVEGLGGEQTEVDQLINDCLQSEYIDFAQDVAASCNPLAVSSKTANLFLKFDSQPNPIDADAYNRTKNGVSTLADSPNTPSDILGEIIETASTPQLIRLAGNSALNTTQLSKVLDRILTLGDELEIEMAAVRIAAHPNSDPSIKSKSTNYVQDLELRTKIATYELGSEEFLEAINEAGIDAWPIFIFN